VLHPYYKLDYIRVAWGGPEEQAAEIAAGNPNAKNWQGEALKIVERTMVEYWAMRFTTVAQNQHTAPNLDDDNVPVETTDLRDDFYHHRKQLLKHAMTGGGGGWQAELRHYLKDIPNNVTREMDIVEWWAVSKKMSY
jgi:hypothetical protein